MKITYASRVLPDGTIDESGELGPIESDTYILRGDPDAGAAQDIRKAENLLLHGSPVLRFRGQDPPQREESMDETRLTELQRLVEESPEDPFVHYGLALEGFDAPIAQAFTIGRTRFILTDARSARDPSSIDDGPEKSILGAEQLAGDDVKLADVAGGGNAEPYSCGRNSGYVNVPRLEGTAAGMLHPVPFGPPNAGPHLT